MKKKLLGICLSAAMTVALLSGCGSGTSSSSGSASQAADSTSAGDSTAAGTVADSTATDSTAADSATADAAADSGSLDSVAEDSTAADSTGADTAADGGTLTVGFDQDFPPMGFVDEDGSYVGFDLELAEEVAKRLGLEYTAQPIAWDSKDMELEAGTIDCIWNGFTINGREDKYEWTKPYLDNKQVFVVADSSGIKSTADLSGKIVEVQADSSAEAALNDNTDLSGTFTMQQVADYNTGFMDLESGAVDAVAMDEIVARYQIETRDAKFTVLDESIASEEYGVGFKKGNTALRDKVQATLDEMASDGTAAKISEKWFGKDITTIGKS